MLALVVGKGEVFHHGEVWTGAEGGVLVDPADALIAFIFLKAVDLFTANEYLAALNGDASADDIEQRSLAAAVAAYDGHKFLILDR